MSVHDSNLYTYSKNTINKLELNVLEYHTRAIATEKGIKILEEQLELAKKVEDYETCARLRDEISAREEEKVAGENKNNKGISKKDKKDLASENLDNKGLPEDDDWNF